MYNLFSIFIERFTIFTFLIFVILKNLMVFISPPLWTLWNYKKQKLRDGLIIAIGSLPHPFWLKALKKMERMDVVKSAIPNILADCKNVGTVDAEDLKLLTTTRTIWTTQVSLLVSPF